MKYSPIILSIMLAACSRRSPPPPPQSQCINPIIQRVLLEMFFKSGERHLDANETSALVDWKAVKTQLQSLKADDLFSFGPILFQGYNRQTKATQCDAWINITLPKKYKERSFVQFATAVQDSSAPGDLFNGKPSVEVHYTIQPDANAKDDVIFVSPTKDLLPIADTLFVLSVAKWQAGH